MQEWRQARESMDRMNQLRSPMQLRSGKMLGDHLSDHTGLEEEEQTEEGLPEAICSSNK